MLVTKIRLALSLFLKLGFQVLFDVLTIIVINYYGPNNQSHQNMCLVKLITGLKLPELRTLTWICDSEIICSAEKT
jgi:hypothetical protein